MFPGESILHYLDKILFEGNFTEELLSKRDDVFDHDQKANSG